MNRVMRGEVNGHRVYLLLGENIAPGRLVESGFVEVPKSEVVVIGGYGYQPDNLDFDQINRLISPVLPVPGQGWGYPTDTGRRVGKGERKRNRGSRWR